MGGTFDPVHLGHLVGAQAALDRLELDRLLFVPAKTPPHKAAVVISPVPHRLAMLRLALADNPALGLCLDELERPGPSFTVDTLRAFRARCAPGDELFFILGADQLAEFDSWKDWREILALAALAVLHREGSGRPEELVARLGGPLVRWVEMPLIGISGTAIRQARREGRSIRYLVPDPVAAYIEANRLYCGEGESSPPIA